MENNNRFRRKADELLRMLTFDPTTYSHSLNVAQYSKKFIKLLDVNIDADTMYYSGLFHDIGKIRINLNILNKKSMLNTEEYNSMMKHSKLGYGILKKAFMPKEMVYAAYFHHERWDGNGYPVRLEGDKIPKVARVISICDVFDALTSDRPYRKAYSMYEALNIMENSEGQFDKELLKVFTDSLDSIIGS